VVQIKHTAGNSSNAGRTTSINRSVHTDLGSESHLITTDTSAPADLASITRTKPADFGGHTTPNINHVPHIGTGHANINATIAASYKGTTNIASCGECAVPTLDSNHRSNTVGCG
jgi:hypothetical protein